MKVLVTGAAGFIGYHVCNRLLDRGNEVVGMDCFLKEPYGVELKRDRADGLLVNWPGTFSLLTEPVEKLVTTTPELCAETDLDAVIHLASRAGVRGSGECPADYVQRNVLSFAAVLEFCARFGIPNVVYASTSSAKSSHSVYGASKRACELLAEAWCRTRPRMRVVGLRYFTVIGAWGRPDMAAVGFARKMLKGEPVEVYGLGLLRRTFTYVGDVADVTIRATFDCTDRGHYVHEVGPCLQEPPSVMNLVALLEKACGERALVRLAPTPKEDVEITRVTEKLPEKFWWTGWTTLECAVRETVEWVRRYYRRDRP